MFEIDEGTDPAPDDIALLEQGMRRVEPELFRRPCATPRISITAHSAAARMARSQPVSRQVCFWDGVEIEMLWVDGRVRGQGLGTRLLKATEAFVSDHDAVVAYLETVDARFYQGHGYEVFGILEDRPIGSSLFFMSKGLDPCWSSGTRAAWREPRLWRWASRRIMVRSVG